MNSRFVHLPLLALAFTLAGTAAAQQSAAAVAADPGEAMVEIKLPDADLDTMLSALEIYTGRVILRPAALPTATYNLRITKPIPKSEAVLYIQTILALNGIALTPLGDHAFKVTALQNARAEAPELINGSAYDLPASGRVATKLFQLEFARVQEIISLFQATLNPLYGGAVALPTANAVLITDSISNLQRVETMLQQVDRPMAAGMKPKFYTLRNAKASDLVNKLRTILSGTLQQQLGSATTYNADDRTNQIVLVTDRRQHAFFDNLILKLDVKADPNTRNEVIYLKSAKAADVVNVLSRIISGQTTAIQRQNAGSVRPGQGVVRPPAPTPAGAPAPNAPQPTAAVSAAANNLLGSGSSEFSSLMTVVNDDRSNSVVVSGTVDDIRLITELINKLDIVLAQVRIEVVIAEVTLGDNHQTGISALGLQLDGDKLVGFSGSLGGIPSSVTISNGALIRSDGTTAVSGAWDLAAEIAINTTPRKSSNAILSVPAIVTSHGKEAEFFTGETRPVVTGTIAAGGGATTGLTSQSTITQQEIGTTLTATPFIGVDGTVQLELSQNVQDVIGTVLVDQNTQYIIGTRKTKSYITAKSGEIIVMAGFQKSTDTKTTSRLGPIPIIGDLFGSRKKETSRQELIFFLRPTVLTNNPAIDNAPAMRRIEQLPTRDQIKQHLDQNSQPAPRSGVLDKIIPQ